MSPPSKWLRISTTLFQQSVSAYRQGVLQLKTLKDGFECPPPLPPPHSICRIILNNRFHATIPGTLSPRSNPLPDNPTKNLPSRDNPALPRNPVLPPCIPLPRSPNRRPLLLHPGTPQNLPSLTNPRALYSQHPLLPHAGPSNQCQTPAGSHCRDSEIVFRDNETRDVDL